MKLTPNSSLFIATLLVIIGAATNPTNFLTPNSFVPEWWGTASFLWVTLFVIIGVLLVVKVSLRVWYEQRQNEIFSYLEDIEQ